MGKLRSTFREFLEERDRQNMQFLQEHGWLNSQIGGPIVTEIELLLRPYLNHEGPIPQENLQRVLYVSVSAAPICETLGKILAALDWYRIGQYRYRGGRVYSRHLGQEWPDISARDDAGRGQLESAICATRVGNHERARQLYEWAAENYDLSEEEKKGLKRVGSSDVVWERLPYRAYALACLEQWEEALQSAEEAWQYIEKGWSRIRRVYGATYTPVLVCRAVLALARYKVHPSEKTFEQAATTLRTQISISIKDKDFWALFLFYNLRALHPELVAPAVTRAGWGQMPARERQLTHAHPISALAFSPPGHLLAVGSVEGDIYLWETATGRMVRRWRAHPNAIRSLAFSPDGRLLASGANRASGSDQPVLRVWQVETAQLLYDLPGHTDSVTGLVFSADGQRLFSASDDGTAQGWDRATGQTVWRSEIGEPLKALALAPDGGRLAGAGGLFHGRVYVWQTTDGQRQSVLEAHREQACLEGEAQAEHDFWSVAFDKAGGRLAAGCADGSIVIFSLKRRRKAREIVEAHAPGAVWVVLPPGEAVIISAGMETMVRGWGLESGEALWEMEAQAEISALALSADGRTLALGTKVGQVEVMKHPG